MKINKEFFLTSVLKWHVEEFNKIVTILCYLCDEIHEMKETAEEEFYRGIAVFGHVAGEDEDVTDWRNGKAELIMGRSIKFFQVLIYLQTKSTASIS